MRELQDHVDKQDFARREWREVDTPEFLAKRVKEEADELVKAIDEFEVTQDAEYNMVGEVADIAIFLLKFCNHMGIDINEAIEMKLQRNAVKYPDHFLSNGWGKAKAHEMSKSLYSSLGGDHAFYLWHSGETGTSEDVV